MKRCSKCVKYKRLDQFYRNRASKDGRRPDCKACEKVPATPKKPSDRFWSNVHKTPGCWAWVGSTATNNGYGRFWLCGRHVVAHRYSWQIHNGKIKRGLEVCHTCDNPSCVNPDHLFLATHKENMRDMVRKGRNSAYYGEDHPMAKLTQLKVDSIRKKYASGKYTYKKLAKQNNVSQTTIARIIRGESWQ